MSFATFISLCHYLYNDGCRDGTVDYQARRHELQFTLAPYAGTPNLSFSAAQQTLKISYVNTTLEVERNNVKTSGLDPAAIRPAQSGFPSVPTADPQMPIASTSEPHLTLDIEGIVINSDGSYVKFPLSFPANHRGTNAKLSVDTGSVTNMGHISIGSMQLVN